MVTSSPCPSWKWLFKLDRRNCMCQTKESIWEAFGAGGILTHRSWISFKLIFEWIDTAKNKGEKICVFFPEYYCYDTIYQIRDIVDIVYYPLTDNLQPDLKKCRDLCKDKKPDAIVCCHFFGIVKPLNDMSVLAKQQEAFLIEDAVHVLYSEYIGKNSDFIILSPWKLLGLPDGAILLIGKKNRYIENPSEVSKWFEKRQEEFEEFHILKWKIKKIIQKLIPQFLYGRIFNKNYNCKKNLTKEGLFKISEYSKNILRQVSREDILEDGERRKENLMYLRGIMEKEYDIKLKYDYGNCIPYAAVFENNQKNEKDINLMMKKIGNIISKWPALDPNISKDAFARTLYDEMIMISVHQGIDLNYMAKCIGKKKYTEVINDISLENTNEEKYSELLRNAKQFVPLLQSDVWGRVKRETQGWNSEYKIVKKKNEIIGCFLVLSKRKMIRVNRINKGVCWLNSIGDDIKNATYKEIKRQYSGFGRVLFIAPGEQKKVDTMVGMLNNGYRYRKKFYSSGLIDLSQKEEKIRENLDSKWRNQLKKAEKSQLKVFMEMDEGKLKMLLNLHAMHKREKNYTDSGDEITRGLIKDKSIIAFVAENEGEIIGFIMVTRHENNATYYIGWSNQKGYNFNVNKLLLWNAVLELRKTGVRWFDLGGIDNINTKNVAEFKLGTGCEYFENVGEFVAW